MTRPELLATFFLAAVASTSLVRAAPAADDNSNWHGYTPPSSSKPKAFRPYFVPKGSKSFDDKNKAILYQGDWSTVLSHNYVGGSLHRTRGRDAQVKLAFSGTGIEWFGTTGPHHGDADVFLDGRWVKRVSTHTRKGYIQQRIWQQFDLPFGAHELRIVNKPTSKGIRIDVDAFVIVGNEAAPSPSNTSAFPTNSTDKTTNATNTSGWSLVQNGDSGISAMQLAVISPTRALVVDKVEHNPITIDGHPAWAAIYDFVENKAYPIRITSNSFCAGGSFLSNGTMVNVGGNAVVEDMTNSADFGDKDGRQGIRFLQNCAQDGDPNDCFLYENPDRIRMASKRWYNTVVRMPDGSIMVIGGSYSGGWINNATQNNPTYEFYPPKDDGLPVTLPFLKDTLNSNLFPIAFTLPDGRMFISANQDSMIYDWKTKTEQRLPKYPNGVRVTYPMTGVGILLPLSPTNNYTAEMLVCGGSTVDDTRPPNEDSAQFPASDQCVRMVLNDEGIAKGWQVEHMPEARTMPDAVLLPTGEVFIVNGANSGIAGYGNVQHQAGQSNADNPAFTPVLYNPDASPESRFTNQGFPTSDIPRLYHSSATLLPDGHILVAGSNPNLDRSTAKYQTEYRVEHFYPPYMNAMRPVIKNQPEKMMFQQNYEFQVDLPEGTDPNTVKGELPSPPIIAFF